MFQYTIITIQWKRHVQRQVNDFEERRRSELVEKRDDLKAKPPVALIIYNFVNGVLTFPLCARSFSARVGYASHMRAHERAAYPRQPP